jgi:hypothetical protein
MANLLPDVLDFERNNFNSAVGYCDRLCRDDSCLNWTAQEMVNGFACCIVKHRLVNIGLFPGFLPTNEECDSLEKRFYDGQ